MVAVRQSVSPPPGGRSFEPIPGRVWSTDLPGVAGNTVTVAGWIHRVRALKGRSFLILRDAKGLAQIVVESPEVVAALAAMPAETAVRVMGLAVAEPQAPNGVEIREPRIEQVSTSETPLLELHRPLISAQPSTMLDHAALALRHPRRRDLHRIGAAAVAGFRETLNNFDFVEIQTPKLVASATESGANVFPVDYFGRPAFLAQSPQFYKQMMVGAFERVYEVGPVFRAEPHDTPRHLNEYTSLDAELGFITDHTTVMDLLTRVLSGMLASVQERAGAALTSVDLTLPSLPPVIPAVHFAVAQELIAAHSDTDPRGEPDLSPAGERWLGEWARREHHSDFLFVVGYPMVKRPFYTHPDPERPGYSRGFDLLFRGLELVTGGQRLHRHEDYLAALAGRGMDPAPFATYLEAFRYGMPSHGGFAIGLERFVAQLAGVGNVREVTLFPRDINRLAP